MSYIRYVKFVFIMWVATLASVANAACDFATHAYRDELANPGQIEHISVEIKKSRKWFKNSISILASNNPSIEDDFKDKQSATLNVQYRFGSCRYPARVRQNGDWKDHIKLLPGGNVVSSLDIRLQEGNILNAVRFKLLLPETRQGINEALGALLLQELGYLSPETFLVSADINGVQQTMLFQENAEKELLERRNRREGPIFEGDESLLWNLYGFEKFELEDVSLARQTNSKWAKKGNTSTQISLDAYKRLQAAYVDFTGKVENVEPFLGLGLVPNIDVDEPTFETYAITLIAMHGAHALRPHNRKFYFNSFTQSFEPIYYDGNINFLGPPLTQNGPTFPRTLEHFLKFASPEIILETAGRVKTLADDASFYQAFLDRAGTDKTAADAMFKQALSKVSERLYAYHDTMMTQENNSIQKAPVDTATLQRQLIERTKTHGLDAQYLRVVGKTETGNFLARFADDKDADSTFELSPFDLIGIMSKNTYEDKRVSLLPEPSTADAEMPETVPFLKGEIVLSKGTRTDINYGDRTMTVSQKAPNDWVLIRGVALDNWNISFDGVQQDPNLVEGQRFNEFGLTGCLNFYDVTFKDVTITGRHGQCEDSVNIVSSKGTLSALVVEDGFADAIDIDFSQITIDRLDVSRTGNDCFDVSTGVFEINQAVLVDCGDKGISVGENSLLYAVSVDIRSAVIGVSSKDFSRVNIEQLSGDQITICAEAFQKKQEFGGGFLRVDAFQCAGEVNQDSASNIVLNEVSQ